MKKKLKYLLVRICYNVHFEETGMFARAERGEKGYNYHFTPKRLNLAIVVLILLPFILIAVIGMIIGSSILAVPKEIMGLYHPKKWSSYYQVLTEGEEPSKRKAYENF